MRILKLAGMMAAWTLFAVGVHPAVAAGQAAPAEAVKLDVLFIGAHPDDETFAIPSFGQWSEYNGVRSGVLTITRGEGGGNAVGPEEGEALGLLREAEERRAVGHGLVEDIFYLDDVDFFYTVSAPLTEQLWGHQASLSRVVRIIRATRPEVVMTMNPSPVPGNHGNHQYAARLAVEGFRAAADPSVFPEQIKREGLRPWATRKIVQEALSTVAPDAVVGAAAAEAGQTPPPGTSQEDCSRAAGTDPTDVVYNVWRGRFSRQKGVPWAAVGSQAANEYASQGFSGPIAVAFAAFFVGFCDQLTEIDSRVPGTVPARGQAGVFEGALTPAPGGLPAGTLFHLEPSRFRVVGGVPFTVTAHALAGKSLGAGSVKLAVPDGWTVSGSGALGALEAGQARSTTFAVTAPAGAAPGRLRLAATLTAGAAEGTTVEAIEVVPAVTGTLQALPHVEEFRSWAERIAPQLDNLIVDRQSIGVGESRTMSVTLTNHGERAESGTVTLAAPAGFAVEPPSNRFDDLGPGERRDVSFRVSNTDPALATSNDGGDYPLTITTSIGRGESSKSAALNLVPVTEVPGSVTAPEVDGVEGATEYPGPVLDLSRQWEGLAPPLSPADASGSARIVHTADAIYLIVHVTDNKKGAVLPPSDCKRHWRTDSVEIAIDPRGGSENTSTTFKAALLAETADAQNGNPPCFSRDADHHQGPGPQTAPGMKVASTVSAPYTGYTVEAKIPFSVLPAAVDPKQMGLNVFIYDSDTEDKTGLHRLGWSTWGGVQGDPYRWGHAVLPGYAAPGDLPLEAPPARVPDTAAQSIASPQSIAQSVRNGVPLGGHAAVAPAQAPVIRSVTLRGDDLVTVVESKVSGRAHVFAYDGRAALAHSELRWVRRGQSTVTWRLEPAARAAMAEGGVVLLGFVSAKGDTAARKMPVGGASAAEDDCDPTPARGFRRVRVRGGRNLRLHVVRRVRRAYRVELLTSGGKARRAGVHRRSGAIVLSRRARPGSYRVRVVMRLGAGRRDARSATAKFTRGRWRVGSVRRGC